MPALDGYWNNIAFMFVFFCICQFIYPFSQVVSQIIHEKADKIKEGMVCLCLYLSFVLCVCVFHSIRIQKMMGSSVATYWASWYLWLFIEATVIAVLCVIVGVGFNLYKWSDPTLIFLWLWLFMLNLYAFGVLFSCFFDVKSIYDLFFVCSPTN